MLGWCQTILPSRIGETKLAGVEKGGSSPSVAASLAAQNTYARFRGVGCSTPEDGSGGAVRTARPFSLNSGQFYSPGAVYQQRTDARPEPTDPLLALWIRERMNGS